MKEEPAMVVAADTAHQLAAGRGSSAGTAVDKNHIQDTADNTVDTVVAAAGTTVLKSGQQLEQQLDPGNLR